MDRFGRPVLNLRVSVTERCNLHCSYCHKEGEEKFVKNHITEMTSEEIFRLVRIATSLGIEKVKLTGGEPLMREDITEIVAKIGRIPSVRDLSMTTNGTLLTKYAKELYNVGLTRVNVNLPTLKANIYSELTGGNLYDVLRGIKEAIKVGLHPVKLNMLILRGVNDGEVEDMIKFAGKIGAVLQLIELEPINVTNDYYKRYHNPLDGYEFELKKRALRVKNRRFMHNRPIYYLPEAKVEVIHPIENTEFCSHCTRLRITSDGKLKPCLMKNDNLVDVLTPIRNGADDKEIKELFMEAVRRREPYYKRVTKLALGRC